MFQKILCALDFSEPSQNALMGALRIAHQEGARLFLVNVMETGPHDASKEIEAQIRWMRETTDEKIREYFPATGKSFMDQIEFMVLRGHPVQELLRIVSREIPDLVVLATHGRTGLMHFMLGSVAEKIVRHSISPVLLVRKPTQWPPQKVLLPIDFSESGEEAIMLASQLNAEKTELLHVLGMPDLIALSVRQAESSAFNEAALREEALKKLSDLRSRHASLKNASIHVSIGPTSEEIGRRAEQEGNDLILIPTEGRSGLGKLLIGSVAEGVVRRAPCNVLCFTTKAALPFRREMIRALG